MPSERAPSITQVQNAASTLARALRVESREVREEEGHQGHSLAQDLSIWASRVTACADQIESLRRGRKR